jgi:hypothetical protein
MAYCVKKPSIDALRYALCQAFISSLPAAFKSAPLDKREEFMLFFDGKHIELFLLTVV